jgi:predicted molibdopterin-dependent oxidoreductase YjgC
VAVAGSGPVTGDVAGVSPETIQRVRGLVRQAEEKAGPGAVAVVVILGRPSLAESEEQVAAAARSLADLPRVAFLSSLRRANVHGALDLGLTPGVLPGRVTLDAGRAWYEHHWATTLPAGPGLTTRGILEAATRGRIGGLVLLGADPCRDFPDAHLAERAIDSARFVVAVDSHLSESSRRADVVLPAAMWAERRGTSTNLEGRITRLGQLVPTGGSSWPDWVIASELAARLGVDLGFASLDEIWDEVVRLSPLHQGIGYGLLSRDEARDGLLVPASRQPTRADYRARPLDPMADTGIYSAELHNVAPTAMLHSVVSTVPEGNGSGTSSDTEVGSTGGPAAPTVAAADTEDRAPEMPPMLGLPPIASPGSGLPPGQLGGPGTLRLVTSRTLWDGGTQVDALGYLAALAPPARLVVHPSVLADLGAADGETVRVVSRRGTLELPGSGDFTVPPGIAWLPWNLPDGRAGELIDTADPVTELRVELAPPGGGVEDG